MNLFHSYISKEENNCPKMKQGPIVQCIVSLMSLLRGRLVKFFLWNYNHIHAFFVEKMREAFALQQKNIGAFQVLAFEILTKC